ncbi:MAG: hypothetical protein ABI091_18520 [Ferruginibacter sp.]
MPQRNEKNTSQVNMGLDNIELNLKICSRLYKNSLVVKPKFKKTEKAVFKPIEYEGANKKNILFIVRKGEVTGQSSKEMDLLNSMCKACNLTLDDIALVNFNTSMPDYAALRTQFKFKFLLAFGVTPSDISLTGHFEDFHIAKQNDAQLIFVPQLNEFLNNKVYKASLWKGMQQLFF